MTTDRIYDVLVVGGGINGCGIARDAAGRGFSVLLAEKDDLASGTSSASTKLIHGGLRYLEHYEFRLVREALREREVLWRNAPHIVRPMRFVLPHHAGLRPAWLLRLGLFFYDYLGGRRALAATKVLDLRTDPIGRTLKPGYRRAFEYSDCWVDDARLVVLNARDAADRGAEILTRTELVSARRDGRTWRAGLRDGNEIREVTARMIVNAAGPWVDALLRGPLGLPSQHNVRLVRGSHIVIARKQSDPRALFLQNGDSRIIFVIPYERDFTLIGTTDVDAEESADGVHITDAEIDYLCAVASEYLAQAVTPDQVVWTYAGLRALFDDGAQAAQEATRDYVLRVDGAAGEAPLANVFGGKITTYRRLAEAAMDEIETRLGARGAAWTSAAPLPGGELSVDGIDAEVGRLLNEFSFLSLDHALRLVRLYGSRANRVLGNARRRADLGRHFGHDLYEVELRYLCEVEWARTAEDVLWRRTKLGLRFSGKEVGALADVLQRWQTEGRGATA